MNSWSRKSNGKPPRNGHGPALLFSGDRRNRNFVALVHGAEVGLPTTLFDTLLDLVAALLTTDTGFTPIRLSGGDEELARTMISRLRRRIDQALQPGAGKALIETGAGTEYRLRLSRQDVGAKEAFFKELPPNAVAKDLLEILRNHCGKL